MARIGGMQGIGATEVWQAGPKGKTATASNQGVEGSVFNKAESTKGVEQTQKAQDTPQAKAAKKACESDLAAFKKAGVTVSGWDASNTCILSHKGVVATVQITPNGEVNFGGDFETIMNHLTQADSAQQQAMQKYEAFIQSIEADGGSLIDQKTSTVKSGGKEIQVIEMTIQDKDGKQTKAYMDDDGNQVKPD